MKHYPHITVATVVPMQGRFLMVQEKADGALVYNQPAGHVEVGEDLVSAAVRETFEETGWQVHIESLIGVYSHIDKRSRIHYLRHCFLAKPEKQSSPTPPDCDIVQALWLTRDQITSASDQLRSPLVIRALLDYANGDRYSLGLLK